MIRVLVVLLALTRIASAHQTSVKYVGLTLDRGKVHVALRVAPGDVTEPLGLPADSRPTAEQASTRAVAAYVQHWLAIEGCTAGAPVAAPDDKLVAVTWTDTCKDTRELVLDFAAFFAIDRRHIAIVRLEGPGLDPTDVVVRAGESRVTMHAGMTSVLAWIHTGMDHIYEGRDHISFVLALLLVVMLERRATWQTRGFVATLKRTATVITAFTIAHSISLIAASLGYVALPSRFVESMIALSIAYTAVEDIVKPDVTWRYWLTFGFGLIHGLGFASTLSELLPPHDVLVPLLCFNVGVELGQLTIVLVALPVFYLVARKLGAERYRRELMPAIAGIICVAGLIWIAERVLQVTILGM